MQSIVLFFDGVIFICVLVIGNTFLTALRSSMDNNYEFFSDFTNPDFKEAFIEYFGEIHLSVDDWDGLFESMCRDRNENFAYVYIAESGQVAGFLQFTLMDMESWFFKNKTWFCAGVLDFKNASQQRAWDSTSQTYRKIFQGPRCRIRNPYNRYRREILSEKRVWKTPGNNGFERRYGVP